MADEIKAEVEILTIEAGILYKENGDPVMPDAEEDKPYRRAYKALFRRMGQWPPDGEYEFVDGKMTLTVWRPKKIG
jgi:hypothetical protein